MRLGDDEDSPLQTTNMINMINYLIDHEVNHRHVAALRNVLHYTPATRWLQQHVGEYGWKEL